MQVSLTALLPPYLQAAALKSFCFVTQLLNITMSVAQPAAEQKVPVEITFAVRDSRGYLPGSEVSEHLRKLSLVEFSFYVGFPVLQIAERTAHKCRTCQKKSKPTSC